MQSHAKAVVDVESLLKARAARYALLAHEDRRILHTVVTFRRGESRYALALEELREIRPLTRFCPLPGASAIVPGLVHYRGELLSVHDLARFTSDQAAQGSAAWVLVAEHGERRLGLMADDVMDVLEIEVGGVQAVPITLGEAAEVFTGMTSDGVLLVDAPRMFQVPRFASAF